MGFQSMDDVVTKLTAATPQVFRIDWQKVNTVAMVANRWYDLSMFQGTTPAHGGVGVIGEWVSNSLVDGGADGWDIGGQWSWAGSALVRVAGGAATSLTATMQATVVAGYVYRVTTIIAAIGGVGNLFISIGGTAGANYTTTGTKVEYITAGGATALKINISAATKTCTISSVSAIAVANAVGVPYGSNSMPLSDTCDASPHHGGDVSPQTKHVLNVGAYSATQVPGRLMLIDQLMVYAGINLASAAAQTLTTGSPLPRYATGKGVRAYMVCTTASGAVSQNMAISYTNTVPTAGKTLPVTVASTLSSVAGHLLHTGTNPNNYGPFLPLANGDLGITSVDSVTMSVANASGEAAIVLCKPLLTVPVGAVGVAGERDLLNQLPSLPRIYDGANLQWLFFGGAAFAAATSINGYLDVAWG